MSESQAKTGGQLLVDALKTHGVRQAFCLPGESYLAVLDALYDAPEIELTVCRHEGAAAMMADAHGKLSGRAGVCLVTRAPGATNASAGLHIAFQDSTPLLLLIGQVGRQAVEIARTHGNGWMATLLRKPGEKYEVTYGRVPLEEVANSERTFPAAWLAESRIDVTDDFVRYARPLIGEEWPVVPLENGLQRFARFQPVFADRQCPDYVPEAHRRT